MQGISSLSKKDFCDLEYLWISTMNNSDCLDGAISIDNEYDYLVKCNFDASLDWSPMSTFVPSSFSTDNDIVINKDRALAGAYFLDEDKLEEQKAAILAVHQLAYPDYHFEIEEGCFPISVCYNEFGDYYVVDGSNYVVYITDYKDHINNKQMQMKKK